MARPKESSGSTVLLYLLAIFIPPLAVAMTPGQGCAAVLINLCLWILGWIPGVIHAWWVIAKSEKAQYNAARHQQHQHYAAPPPPQQYAAPPGQPRY